MPLLGRPYFRLISSFLCMLGCITPGSLWSPHYTIAKHLGPLCQLCHRLHCLVTPFGPRVLHTYSVPLCHLWSLVIGFFALHWHHLSVMALPYPPIIMFHGPIIVSLRWLISRDNRLDTGYPSCSVVTCRCVPAECSWQHNGDFVHPSTFRSLFSITVLVNYWILLTLLINCEYY